MVYAIYLVYLFTSCLCLLFFNFQFSLNFFFSSEKVEKKIFLFMGLKSIPFEQSRKENGKFVKLVVTELDEIMRAFVVFILV